MKLLLAFLSLFLRLAMRLLSDKAIYPMWNKKKTTVNWVVNKSWREANQNYKEESDYVFSKADKVLKLFSAISKIVMIVRSLNVKSLTKLKSLITFAK